MFKELYKSNVEIKGNQEERRQALLEKQKEERRNLQDKQRTLEEIFLRPLEQEPGSNGIKSRPHKNNNWQQRQHDRLMQNFNEMHGVDLSLQQSEWLREYPSDICDWLLVPCPRGQRSLVVAHNRQTVVYNKVGRCVCVFHSMLPGDGVDNDTLTILDCIYIREQNVFYVLDVLAFGGSQNLLYCEAEFRFFWLRSKWDEHENLQKRSDNNQKPFYLLKQFDFENMTSIAEAFQRYPLWPNNKPELDGFLFYHRFANYTCGTTPLVGWLFAFMVPDVLDMQVNEQYEIPKDYVDPLTYMDQFDARLEEKFQRRKGQNARNEKRKDMEVDSTDLRPKDLSLVSSVKIGCKSNSPNLSDLACCNDLMPRLMSDDRADESEEESSLQKLLEAQRDLEMQSYITTDEINFDKV